MKAIAQSTGRTIAQIKSDANATGDLGIVAEQSRSSQCMIFQPARLTVQSVFSKLKAIAQMSGHSVSMCNIKYCLGPRTSVQTCSTFYVVQATLATFGMHAHSMKFNTQNEELMSVMIIIYII